MYTTHPQKVFVMKFAYAKFLGAPLFCCESLSDYFFAVDRLVSLALKLTFVLLYFTMFVQLRAIETC